MIIQPRERVALHETDLARLADMRLSLQPAGYETTDAFTVAPVPEQEPAAPDSVDEAGNCFAEQSIEASQAQPAACQLQSKQIFKGVCCWTPTMSHLTEESNACISART